MAPSAYAEEVNNAFAQICPELKSKYAIYPIPEKYRGRWLGFDEEFEGKPTVIPADAKGTETPEDYVYCKNAPRGKGYYHVLTKVAYVNLYSRLSAEEPGTFCCFGDREHSNQWDTARRVVYNRSRANRPDDAVGAVQAIDHLEGNKLNPVHGLKL